MFQKVIARSVSKKGYLDRFAAQTIINLGKKPLISFLLLYSLSRLVYICLDTESYPLLAVILTFAPT